MGGIAVPSVLFVCLGNICRSPLARQALCAEAAAAGVEVRVDSAGTGDWHVGQPPDRRAQAAAREAGHDIAGFRARQVTPEDFRRYDHIVALDRRNLADLRAMRPADATAVLSLLLDHVPSREGEDVFDPYYGSDEAFAETWADVTLGARGLLALLSHSAEIA